MEDNHHWDMVYFKTVGETSDPCPAPVCVGDDNDLVPPLDQALREMVKMGLDSSGIWIKEIRYHASKAQGSVKEQLERSSH